MSWFYPHQDPPMAPVYPPFMGGWHPPPPPPPPPHWFPPGMAGVGWGPPPLPPPPPPPPPPYGWTMPMWDGGWVPPPVPPPYPPGPQVGGSWAWLTGWAWTVGPRHPRNPVVHNPFWPYPLPALPPDHLVWRWLATIDGGPWEDASLIPEHSRMNFKTKIVHYHRVAIYEGNPEYNNPAVFGLYPPAGPKAPTVATLSTSPSTSPSRSHSPAQGTHRSSSQNNNQEQVPEQIPDDKSKHSSSEESVEIGRGYTAPDNMDFQSFSDSPSPIRGNFIPVSDGFTSPSPASLHKGQQLSPINETITETDEENFEELIARGKMQYRQAREAYHQGNSTPERRHVNRDGATSSRRSRSRSPDKYSKSATPSRRSRSSSPVKSSARRPGAGQPRVSFTFHDSDDEEELSAILNLSAASKKKQDYVVSPMTPASPAASLSRRRLMPDLDPIDVSVARQEARAEALRKGHIPVAMHVPEKDAREIQQRTELVPPKATHDRNYSSSDYSEKGNDGFPRESARVDPLQVNRRPPSNRVEARQSIFDTYLGWKAGMNKRASGAAPLTDDDESVFEPDYHAQKKDIDMSLRKKASPQVSKAQQAGYNGDHYSPLDVMFPFENQVTMETRKVSKTMIGSKGWLEDTSTSPQKPSPPKNTGFFDALRKKAKELVNMGSEQLKAPRHPNKSMQDVRERQLVISLDPREQSLLYCELEFILASALNSYITCQFNAGRLVTDKLKRISDAWQQRGRPKVVGFRYDVETQLDLVRLHVPEFRFYTRQVSEAAIYGVIDMMRVNARAMRVRTYCHPDTVISKQILDTRNLLNLIGSGEDEHVALASVTQFYRDALARETVFHCDAAEHHSDSTRLRNADRHWRQNREDTSGLVDTPQSGSGYAKTPQSGSRYVGTPQSGSRYADRSFQGYQSRENSSVAATTPHKSPYKSSRSRTRTPDTPWPNGGMPDMMA